MSECSSCGRPGVKLRDYDPGYGPRAVMHLCGFCEGVARGDLSPGQISMGSLLFHELQAVKRLVKALTPAKKRAKR